VRSLADRIRRDIAGPLDADGHEIVVTVSVGLFLSEPGERISASTALSGADMAMYAAKGHGRNRVVAFEPDLRQDRLDGSWVSMGLRQALVDDEFSIQYQPIVELSTGRVVAVEALLRWTRQDGQDIAPDTFIPIAEESGTISLLGAWALRSACSDAARWYRDYGVAMSVNVSGRQLDERGFADMVIQLLADTGLPGRALILELTETTLVSLSSTAPASAQLRLLREQGIRIAIDDFGTGYSSLAYLSRLPVDIVKLDRAFTAKPLPDAPQDPQDWEFIHTIIQMIESLGLQTIAEGIETQPQADVLRHFNCLLAQGYLFSAPVDAETVSLRLAAARHIEGVPTTAHRPRAYGSPHSAAAIDAMEVARGDNGTRRPLGPTTDS
jgi:diguanylate cyclase